MTNEQTADTTAARSGENIKHIWTTSEQNLSIVQMSISSANADKRNLRITE